MLGGLDYVKTDVISVPVVRDAEVSGYFLTKLVYTVTPEIMPKLSVPADSIIVDAVYSFLFGSPDIDFTRTAELDLDRFRTSVRDAVNKRVGEDLVHEVLVEQIEYLTKDEIRDNALRRRVTDMQVALYIEEHEPSLQAAILSAVDAGATDAPVSIPVPPVILERLIAQGLMTAAGLAAIEVAKQNGSWTSLDGIESVLPPPELQSALGANAAAKRQWVKYTLTCRKQFLFWLAGAKRPDTRARRVAAIVECAAKGLTFAQYYEASRK